MNETDMRAKAEKLQNEIFSRLIAGDTISRETIRNFEAVVESANKGLNKGDADYFDPILKL